MLALDLQKPVALVLRRRLKLEVAEVRDHFVVHRPGKQVPTEKDRSRSVRVPLEYAVCLNPFRSVDRSHAVEQSVHWTS